VRVVDQLVVGLLVVVGLLAFVHPFLASLVLALFLVCLLVLVLLGGL
jgi:hypothetical protein